MEKLDLEEVRRELRKLLGKDILLLGESTDEESGIRTINLGINLYLWGDLAEKCAPTKTARIVREYLSPRPSILQRVVVTEKFEEEAPAMVIDVDDDAGTFLARGEDGSTRGPFKFVDILDTWRKG